MYNPDMLSEIAVLLATYPTWWPMLVMHIAYVALQISLKVAAVATVTALEVLHLQQGKVHLKGI